MPAWARRMSAPSTKGFARSRPCAETGRYTSSVVSRLIELRRLASGAFEEKHGKGSPPLPTSAAPPPRSEDDQRGDLEGRRHAPGAPHEGGAQEELNDQRRAVDQGVVAGDERAPLGDGERAGDGPLEEVVDGERGRGREDDQDGHADEEGLGPEGTERGGDLHGPSLRPSRPRRRLRDGEHETGGGGEDRGPRGSAEASEAEESARDQGRRRSSPSRARSRRTAAEPTGPKSLRLCPTVSPPPMSSQNCGKTARTRRAPR